MTSPLAAVVLCAGKGTRMKSDKAKVLHPVLGRPLCAFPLTRAVEIGATPLVAVVGHQAEAVESAIRSEFPKSDLRFALQAEQNGTGHAVRCAQAVLQGYSGTVLILYGDTPLLTAQTLKALVDAKEKSGSVLSLVTAETKDPFGYGRAVRKNGQVALIREQKDCSPDESLIREVNAGIYAADAAFLFSALEKLTPKNAQGEYYLTDLVEMAAQKGGVASVLADFQEIAGVNDRADLSDVSQLMQRSQNRARMKAGVTFLDSDTTFIDDRAQISPDVEIGPMVTISGACRIGRGVHIGQGCVLSHSTVEEGVELRPYSVLEEAQVGPRSLIGPFSRLRPGTELAEEVHIGNFVETKKTRIGKKSKANHLAYLGDAKIGEGVNVGAGTITCNYDGEKKHLTELGDRVFIGSDSQLVAPVKVGDGAYVAAGTTVTKDVPSMALALSRSPQVNVEDWVSRKKGKRT